MGNVSTGRERASGNVSIGNVSVGKATFLLATFLLAEREREREQAATFLSATFSLATFSLAENVFLRPHCSLFFKSLFFPYLNFPFFLYLAQSSPIYPFSANLPQFAPLNSRKKQVCHCGSAVRLERRRKQTLYTQGCSCGAPTVRVDSPWKPKAEDISTRLGHSAWSWQEAEWTPQTPPMTVPQVSLIFFRTHPR